MLLKKPQLQISRRLIKWWESCSLIKCDPFFGIAECIKKLKLSSASELKKKFPELMKRVPNIWTRQVYVRTLGNSSVNDMINFIEAQSKK